MEKDDDAQVTIFETLNARGEPLLPADLLRNYIFLRAARLHEPQEALYEKYWRGFDDEFWRQEVRQGRLIRPRSDLFIQHFLASRRTVDIPVTHLFVEYKFWIERTHPFGSVTDELATLARQREQFRRIVQPDRDDVIQGLAAFLESFDVGTAYPLVLFLLDTGTTDADWKTYSTLLESYILRRAILGWTTKAYNRIFLNFTKTLRASGPTPAKLKAAMSELSGASSGWPTDAEVSEAWRSRNAYDLNNARVTHILQRIGETYRTKKNEPILVDGPLTVEHILPREWVEHWPLPDGKTGLSIDQLQDATPDDATAVASRRRNAALQTFGNLTILTQELNSSVSNTNWKVKQPALLDASLLPINQQLRAYPTWDEETIQQRGDELLARALKIWPATGV